MKYPGNSYRQSATSSLFNGQTSRAKILVIACMSICLILFMALPLLFGSFSDNSPHHHEYVKPPPIAQDLYKEVNHHDQKNHDEKTDSPTLPPPRVKVVRETEKIELLRQLNKHYHVQRQSISDTKPRPFRVHTFFTMDCTDHSIWQAGTLEHSWEKVGQEGFLTRIISGCETAHPDKVKRTQRHFFSSDEFAEKRRGSFYAPYASTLPSGRHYAPYNRPHSVYYWLKHADLESEEVFVMLDPDMVFMNTLPTESVRLGHPVSQVYDYMENTPFEEYRCKSCPKKNYDRRPFAVGPPWMMHIEDWIRVTPRWIQITGELAELYPTNWIVEMLAYSIACKVENLPHAWTYRAMIDNIDDAVVWNSKDDTLGLPNSVMKKEDHHNSDDNNNHPTVNNLPSTLHYCYTLELGELNPSEATKSYQHERILRKDNKQESTSPVLDFFHFSKYRVPTDWPGGKAKYARNFMECKQPLLQEFHSIGYLMDTIFPNGPGSDGVVKIGRRDGNNDTMRIPASQGKMWRRAATMLGYLLPAINEAMTEYKNRYCDEKERNLEKRMRTTHPGHFVSAWVLDSWDKEGRDIKYHRVV